MVCAMKPGSVVIDLAAEAGGNCEATVPGQLAVYGGVKVIGNEAKECLPEPALTTSTTGYTDLASRLSTQSSTLYSNNITKFLLSLSDKDHKGFTVDLDDEVTRGAIVSHNGTILPPTTPAAPPPTPTAATVQTPAKKQDVELTPWQKTTHDVAIVTAGMGSAMALGKFTGPAFMSNMSTFGLAGLVGYRAVWGVVPALHSPLMSVTNAISGQHLSPG